MSEERRFGRRVLIGGVATAGAAVAGLGSANLAAGMVRPSRPLRETLSATGSLRQPDSLPHPHLPAGTDTLPAIEHIVILMMENHSFDDHFGRLGRGDGLTVAPDGTPLNYNPAAEGGFVLSYPMPNTAVPEDSKIGQDWNASHLCWDGAPTWASPGHAGPHRWATSRVSNFPSTTRLPHSSRSATATSVLSWHRRIRTGGS